MSKSDAVVITGGLGYVGQSLAAVLKKRGEIPVVLDYRNIPSQVLDVPVFHGSIADEQIWENIFETYHVDVIYHCAGLIVVSESVREPATYFQENLVAPLVMLNYIRKKGSIPVIFSSSAAVYGTPEVVPIPEETVKAPISPYGITKWQFEEILRCYDKAYVQPWVALRYFNVAGSVEGVMESHIPETHLLPRIAMALTQHEQPEIYGTDYPTPDGTAVRDYIHMHDLVEAHLLAAHYLQEGGVSAAFNVGSGHGHSVQEVMNGFARVTGLPVNPARLPRRAGDPPVLVADIHKAQTELRFKPRYSHDIDRMIQDTWELLTARE
ncbi:MAG: UDP-glucose 4-epimerase GalE [Firmicutes bacterium]|jgi:UDP-glucose 4-epimerase|uniref:UDP-glucose 4-epimerase n=1 Tax=Sulfobacillus benefaciens TaxID=453960 RepID=A0A2T2XAA5_9FIRM|nr:UDP-glucose 4-epimerase GalE [Bacillota bacterium]MCL5015560.1 UDP-glucose 4-epimerase GalE [Bacillota bacterium]PSR31420.1 MAG: UDP-glucose 4-epimerase GalE [Sulfobacillus benefaciens]